MNLFSNSDSWIPSPEIGSIIPPYRPTFEFQGEFINKNHQFFSQCPLRGDVLIDIGISGWLRREDALKLYEMAFFINRRILELGTYHGLSTSILSQAVRDSQVQRWRESSFLRRMQIASSSVFNWTEPRPILSDDLDPECVRITHKNLRQRKLRKYVRLENGDADQFCAGLVGNENTFDFVFVDHSHAYSEVIKVCLWLPRLVTRGGFILFHDFNDPKNNDLDNPDYGVTRAVNEALDGEVFEFFGIFGCTALFRKKTNNHADIKRVFQFSQVSRHT